MLINFFNGVFASFATTLPFTNAGSWCFPRSVCSPRRLISELAIHCKPCVSAFIVNQDLVRCHALNWSLFLHTLGYSCCFITDTGFDDVAHECGLVMSSDWLSDGTSTELLAAVECDGASLAETRAHASTHITSSLAWKSESGLCQRSAHTAGAGPRSSSDWTWTDGAAAVWKLLSPHPSSPLPRPSAALRVCTASSHVSQFTAYITTWAVVQ